MGGYSLTLQNEADAESLCDSLKKQNFKSRQLEILVEQENLYLSILQRAQDIAKYVIIHQYCVLICCFLQDMHIRATVTATAMVRWIQTLTISNTITSLVCIQDYTGMTLKEVKDVKISML